MRLAWEILRRTARYRWHHARLTRSGQVGLDTFKGSRQFFASGEHFLGVPGWEQIPLRDHYTFPSDPDLSLGEFRRKYEGVEWIVVHGTRWVQDLWGISRVEAPATPASDVDLERLFWPSRPRVIARARQDAQSVEVVRPLPLALVLSGKEVLIRMRLDMPAEANDAIVRDLIKRARDDFAGSSSQVDATNARVRDETMSRASLWLRVWDCRQETAGRIDRKEFVARIARDFLDVPGEFLNHPMKDTRTRRGRTFSDVLNSWTSEAEMDKLFASARKYIEQDDRFYRSCINEALERKPVAGMVFSSKNF
jgi:hypothetical protein